MRHLLAWWRQHRRRPLDWADPLSPIYSPELITPGGHIRHVSSSRYGGPGPFRGTPGIIE